MTEIDILKAKIVRHDVNQPWGFRLEGGADIGEPLTIAMVTHGSPAASIGLREADEVTEIFDTPTEHLTYQQCLDLIGRYKDTLVLTVERRARGLIPANPVLNYHQPEVTNQSPKPYQPLDMTGTFYRHPTQNTGDFQTVQSRPFDAVSISTHPHSGQPNSFAKRNHQENDNYYPAAGPFDNSLDDIDAESQDIPQSRTFRILQSVMQNDASAAGADGLPPPRSAAMEQLKRDKALNRLSAQPGRVKVFMPQQYNSPIGMYSADNVLETFTAQAESVLLGDSGIYRGGDDQSFVYGADL